jgi:hypothetical protein
MNNLGENLGISSNGKILSVERRKEIVITDTIFFRMGQPRVQQYQFEFIANDLRHDHLAAFLEDNYLHTSTPVNLQGSTMISFSIENIPGSYATDRFRIVFRRIENSDLHIVELGGKRNDDQSILLNWEVKNQAEVESYMIERSEDGKNFGTIKTAMPGAGKAVEESFTANDQHPFKQDNYYRIKAITIDGKEHFSNTVKFVPAKITAAISVYPNPVVDKHMDIHFTGQRTGEYYLFMRNQLGQVVYNNRVNITGNNEVKTFIHDKSMAAGTYQLTVVGVDGGKTVVQVLVK